MPIYSLGDKRPQIHDTAWIAPDAQIIGDVVIEEGASVWFGAVLRGDMERITIGAGSNVQEQAMLHTDLGFPLTIGRDCTIGHKAMLHGCQIADTSLVGMGATLLNGSKIAQHCLVGACALVTEGKSFDQGALIMGAPAKRVRDLDEAAIMGLHKSAEHYQANAKRFAQDLQVIG